MPEVELPFYANPPVVERVLGVQFKPLEKLTTAALGAFCYQLDRKLWPSVSESPALAVPLEEFSSGGKPSAARILAVNTMVFGSGLRFQIKNVSNTRAIQVQNGMLHYNCVNGGDATYLRYQGLHCEFMQILQDFQQFVATLGEWKATQWEVSYVNHLPKGTLWNNPEEWRQIFSFPILPPSDLPQVVLEGIAGQWRYEIEPQRGRLYVELQHARKLAEDKIQEILALNLTARGLVTSEAPGWDLEAGLNLGHAVIVRGFAKLVSESAREFWQEK